MRACVHHSGAGLVHAAHWPAAGADVAGGINVQLAALDSGPTWRWAYSLQDEGKVHLQLVQQGAPRLVNNISTTSPGMGAKRHHGSHV